MPPLLVIGIALVALIAIGETIYIRKHIRLFLSLPVLPPFARTMEHPNMRILILGDSTALGTGATGNAHSLGGIFARHYPDAEVMSICGSSFTTRDLMKRIDRESSQTLGTFDLIIIRVGGMDILSLRSGMNFARDQISLLNHVRTLLNPQGKVVLIPPPGNVGDVPLFSIFPVRQFYTWFSWNAHRALARALPRDPSIILLNMYNVPRNLVSVWKQHVSIDRMHLTNEGYEKFYEYIHHAIGDSNHHS